MRILVEPSTKLDAPAWTAVCLDTNTWAYAATDSEALQALLALELNSLISESVADSQTLERYKAANEWFRVYPQLQPQNSEHTIRRRLPEFSIPKITEDHLKALVAKVLPVFRSDGHFKYIDTTAVDHRTQSFLWDPKTTGYVLKLDPVRTVRTLHTYGYHGFFKPSVAEVLAQMPSDLEDKVVAFECLGPETADDLNAHLDELEAGFHVAQTTFYQWSQRPTLLEHLTSDEK